MYNNVVRNLCTKLKGNILSNVSLYCTYSASLSSSSSSVKISHMVTSYPSKHIVCSRHFHNDDKSSGDVNTFDIGDPQKFVVDPSNDKKSKLLELELEILRQEGEMVPTEITSVQWANLLNLPSKTARTKYLKFLWKIERKNENIKKKKEASKQQREAMHAALEAQNIPEDVKDLKYCLNYNSMFIRFYEKTINNFYHHRLFQAMLYDPKIVFDCGYDKEMTSRETSNAAKQIMLAFAENRLHDMPLDLYLCNAHRDAELIQCLHKWIPTMYNEEFPLTITEKSYLDIFNKKDLVYLTPHCQQEMHCFEEDKVYIIGAIVDKANPSPVSLAKAKREGLAMAKLPLNQLSWGSGSGKNLTLNQVLSILLDVRKNNDWQYALRHVPNRKLKGAAEYRVRRKMQQIMKNTGVEDYDITARRKKVKNENSN